jgi:hypothetical protein
LRERGRTAPPGTITAPPTVNCYFPFNAQSYAIAASY